MYLLFVIFFWFAITLPSTSQVATSPLQTVEDRMVDLAKAAIPELSPTEEQLIRHVSSGKAFDRRTGDNEVDDPSTAELWNSERAIRAKIIHWMCTNKQAHSLIGPRGIVAAGLRIDEQLNLSDSTIPFPINFHKCRFMEPLLMRWATTRGIRLEGARIAGLAADGIQVSGDVLLRSGFQSLGEIRFTRARIEGELDCSGGIFNNPTGHAINADGAVVRGGVDFSSRGPNRFEAFGSIQMVAARIGLRFDCSGSKLANRMGFALTADETVFDGAVLLNNFGPNRFQAIGSVRFVNSEIRGNLSCNGARFESINSDALNLENAIIKGIASLTGSEEFDFETHGQLRLSGAAIGADLYLIGAKLQATKGEALFGDRIRVNGNAFLNSVPSHRFEATGEIRLAGAAIQGDLNCGGAKFENRGRDAFTADGIAIKGSVFLSSNDHFRFESDGRIRIASSTIDGQLSFNGSRISNSGGGEAIWSDGISVGNGIFLRSHGDDRFEASGEVRFLGASVKGDLSYIGASFSNPSGRALSLDGVKVSGSVFLRESERFRTESVGEVCLQGAEIEGNFECTGGSFIGSTNSNIAINAEGTRVAGMVSLNASDRNRFSALGTVRLAESRIGGSLRCTGGIFVNSRLDSALFADGIKVEGSVFLDSKDDKKFESVGEVRLVAATIGSNLQCNGGVFASSKASIPAINADQASIRGHIFFKHGATVDGAIHLAGASVDGTIEFARSELRAKELHSFIGDRLRVLGSIFFWKGTEIQGRVSLASANMSSFHWVGLTSSEAQLDLRDARTITLHDDVKSWPRAGSLFLDGFVFERFGEPAPFDWRRRLDWLHRQHLDNNHSFSPHPYEQLALVFKGIGYDYDARKILIAKEDDRGLRTQMGFADMTWHRIKKLTINYGYEPRWALLWMIVIVALGGCVFDWGNLHSLIRPTKADAIWNETTDSLRVKDAHPSFRPWLYSLDEFLPLINLRAGDDYVPDAQRGTVLCVQPFRITTGTLLRWWLAIHIVLGWVLTTLFVAGVTGIIRK